jgi:hypothetical protein
MKIAHLLAGLILCSTLHAESTAESSLDADEWLTAPSPDVSEVNEGELVFFSAIPPGGPFHHHQNWLTITPKSLTTGWVTFEQCHDHLDAVPRTEIAFREGRARKLVVTETSGIDKTWVERTSVQLEGISSGARLCLAGELKLVTQMSDGRLVLKSGPYMRRFLDGYYPMRVSLRVSQNNLSTNIELVHPEPTNGLVVHRNGDGLDIEALFEGRLLLEFELDN